MTGVAVKNQCNSASRPLTAAYDLVNGCLRLCPSSSTTAPMMPFYVEVCTFLLVPDFIVVSVVLVANVLYFDNNTVRDAAESLWSNMYFVFAS